eukprot:Hpha_TRINITY_DN21542_c0_g1::TRINITY_DN21542_c0_g1_i1::g.56::m.56
MTGARLARSAGNYVSHLLGVVGILFSIVITAIVSYKGRRGMRDGAIFKKDNKVGRFWRRYVVGKGEWMSLRDEHCNRWGIAFKSAKPGCAWILSTDLWLSQVVALAYGFAGTSCESCAFLRILDVASCLIILSIICRRKNPYTHPIRRH